MGLLDLLLGKTNPISQFVGENKNTIHGGFAALGRGTNFGDGVAGFAQGAAAGGPADAVLQQSQDEDQRRQQELRDKQAIIAKYSNWFAQRGKPDIAQGIADGLVDPAKAYYDEVTPKAPKDPIKLGSGDTLIDPQTYQPLATSGPAPQPGMMSGPGGSQVPVPGGKEAFDRADSLWKEYQAAEPVKSYQLVRNGYERLRASATQANGQGDVSMIFAYMKMLDPTSVVREGEFATAEQTAGIPTQISNLYNKLLNGERLTDAQRSQFINAADGLYQESVQNLSQANDQYGGRAKQWGVDPDTILTQPETYKPFVPKIAPNLKDKYGLE